MQISELQFSNALFRNPSHYLFWFSTGCFVVDQRSGDGYSLDEFTSSRSVYGFSKLGDAGREDCLCSEQDHPDFPVQEEGQPPKRTCFCEGDKSPSRSTSIFELLVFMTQCWIILIYSLLLFMMTTFRNSIQDGTKFHCPCQKFHPMISWKVCTKWGSVSLINSKPYWNCTTWRIIRRYRFPIIRSWKPWWRGVSSKIYEIGIFCARNGNYERSAWENRIRNSGKESKGIDRLWRRKRYLLSVERKRPVFASRPMQFPPRNPRLCAKARAHCRHTIWANRITRLKCVEEEKHPRRR